MRNRRFNGLYGLIAVGIVIIATTGLAVPPGGCALNTFEIVSEISIIKVLPNDYNPYQALYDEMLYPTVRIESVSGIGTGVIINLDADKRRLTQSYILTAAHVVGNNTSVTVTIYSENVITSIPASVVITDTFKDLALLATEIHGPAKSGTRTYSAKLAKKNYVPYLFTPVYAVGCSLGLNPRPSFGHLCALSDSAVNWEISAPILPGNSGGPVYDATTHEVIGIAVWVHTCHGQLVTTMAGIVPIQTVYQFLESIKFIELPNSANSINSMNSINSKLKKGGE